MRKGRPPFLASTPVAYIASYKHIIDGQGEQRAVHSLNMRHNSLHSVSQPAPTYPPNTLSPPLPGISLTNATVIQDWEDKNLEAQIQIYMTLEHEVASLVSKKNTALDVWSALHLKFEGKGLTTLSMLATQFWMYCCKHAD